MSRTEILRRITEGLGTERGSEVEVPRGYALRLEESRADVLALFTERVADHGVAIRHVGPDELATAVAATLWARQVKRIAVPGDLPYGWLADLQGIEVLADGPLLDADQLGGVEGVVTGCAAAIALTGTLILDGGRAQGRRALTRTAAHHLCVVHADQIAGTVPEAFRRLDPYRPMTWLSAGPSLEVLLVESALITP
ncbi:LutC/YkgG family protein [Actinocorallia longicatena]|uniref:LutC/YkgG family protein n=1 Tax=Actinocorallia longicatena TaxID=111803 RepID=UPI0031DB0BD2